ncbi:MAG TPA: DUF1592 domain-containing protein [Polyangia bacterium]|nr:DUF1592 domain-containing protein [Polyangia bacterium]
MAMGCHGQVGDVGDGGGQLGGANGDGGVAQPCTGMNDPRMVVAGQRIMMITKPQLVNTVRYLIDDTEANAILAAGDTYALTKDSDRHFPPSDGEQETFNETNILPINNLAENVSNYVTMNFATLANTLAKCNTSSDTCATTYLNLLAAKAYRRQLTSDEQTRFTNLYTNLRNQMINGYAMTNTVEQATGYAVWALLMSPQMQWLWELGGVENAKPMQTSTSPAGIYVSDDELASQLSFFMTDSPPDDTTLAAAKAGTLRANLPMHVSRLLGTQVAKDWLRHVMELYFLVNQLPLSPVDPGKFPVDSGLLASMGTETQMFLDNVLWANGSKLNDMLLSRTSFVNSRMAQEVYNIPIPAGADANDLTKFGQATLPMDRSGILTNAGFLTARSRSDGQDLVSRGKSVKAAFLCLISSPPTDMATQMAVTAASGMLSQETGQEQAAIRAKAPVCAQCHGTFDSYGLVLEFYDAIARYRTTYDYLPNMPTIDGTTKLPDLIGGATVHTAAELATNLTQSPTFINCLAKSMLQYGMTDFAAAVELPLPPSQAGCAAADVVQRYQAGGNQTFTGLVNAVTQSPAFVVRNVTP